MGDFDDKEAFANVPVAAAVGSDHARAVLRVLRGAGLQIPFGMDMGDAEEVWGAKLADFPPALLMEATNEWISHNREFPSVFEFLDVYDEVRRRAVGKRSLVTCIECEEADPDAPEFVEYRHPQYVGDNPPSPSPRLVTRGFVEYVDEDGVRRLRACSTCNAKRYEAEQNGCFLPNHEYDEESGCSTACPAGRRVKVRVSR